MNLGVVIWEFLRQGCHCLEEHVGKQAFWGRGLAYSLWTLPSSLNCRPCDYLRISWTSVIWLDFVASISQQDDNKTLNRGIAANIPVPFPHQHAMPPLDVKKSQTAMYKAPRSGTLKLVPVERKHTEVRIRRACLPFTFCMKEPVASVDAHTNFLSLKYSVVTVSIGLVTIQRFGLNCASNLIQ